MSYSRQADEAYIQNNLWFSLIFRIDNRGLSCNFDNYFENCW